MGLTYDRNAATCPEVPLGEMWSYEVLLAVSSPRTLFPGSLHDSGWEGLFINTYPAALIRAGKLPEKGPIRQKLNAGGPRKEWALTWR
jgi:hypothetical protein